MKRALTALACVALLAGASASGLLAPAVAHAQSNNDNSTPLNSRIRRDRALPLETRNFWRGDLTRVGQERRREFSSIFTRCLWDRGNERALAFLDQTDFGFSDWGQVSLDGVEAADRFSFQTCLQRVARYNNSGMRLFFTPEALRQWLLQEAYFDANPDGAEWVVAGNLIGERSFPLSADNVPVVTAVTFADCIVAADPYTSDFLFRTVAGSEDETNAFNRLMPAISGCVPQGQELELSRSALRVWIGEALWHASRNLSAPSVENSQEVL